MGDRSVGQADFDHLQNRHMVHGLTGRVYDLHVDCYSEQVKLAERFERFWGPAAARHLCVSKAMQAELLQNWRVRATVFYDRPPAHFRPTPLKQQVRRLAAKTLKALR